MQRKLLYLVRYKYSARCTGVNWSYTLFLLRVKSCALERPSALMERGMPLIYTVTKRSLFSHCTSPALESATNKTLNDAIFYCMSRRSVKMSKIAYMSDFSCGETRHSGIPMPRERSMSGFEALVRKHFIHRSREIPSLHYSRGTICTVRIISMTSRMLTIVGERERSNYGKLPAVVQRTAV